MRKVLVLLLIMSFSLLSVSFLSAEENLKTDKDFSNSVACFGKNILTKEYKKENTVISPLSIHLALDMLYNGAEGKTEKEMKKTLCYPSNIDKKAISQQSKLIMDNLKSTDSMVLEIANSLWAKKNVKVKKSFINNSKKYFYAEVKNNTNPSLINKWVSNKTHKKINKIVSEDLQIDTALINAIYFNGTWSSKFNKDITRDRYFTTIKGKKIKVPTMYKSETMPYYENDKYQVAKLSYKGNKMSMYVFLPSENSSINNFVKTFSQDEFLNASNNVKRTKVNLHLPKFKTECSFEISKTVKELGMKSAFNGKADFKGISDDFFVSEIIHKTYIDVNESGTEAAAVTAIIRATGCAPGVQEIIKNMYVNRPFFFVLSDDVSNIPVFMGVITEPK